MLSRYSESVREAQQLFAQKFGAGLIEVAIGESDVAPEFIEKADIIVLRYLRGEVYEKYAAQGKAAAARGALVLGLPADNLERFWKMKADARLVAQADQYWKDGGAENLMGFLALVYLAAGGAQKIDVPAPQQQLQAGIYHPKSDRAFANLDEYLRWYRAQKLVPADAPLAAITFFSNNHKFRDLAHVDARVARLEKDGIGAIPAFGWPTIALHAQLNVNGQSPVRVILALNLGFSKQDDADELASYNVPVINLMTTRESFDEWLASPKGITPDRLPSQLNAPERAGANEPTLIGTSEKIEDSNVTRTQPVTERVGAAAKRARRWLTLQDEANRDKRIVFSYYSNPPGKGYLGASYLNLRPSLVALTDRLKQEGYATGGVVNIITRPIERRELEFSGQYGTYDSTNYAARYSDRFFNRLGVTFGYQRLQTGGYNTRPIQVGTTTGTTGTLVTGIIPTLTTQGARTFDIGAAGDNWYNQHAYRVKGDYAFTNSTQISVQYIRQDSAYGYAAATIFPRDTAGNVIERGPVLSNDNGTTRRLNFTPGTFLQGPGNALSHFINGSLLHKFSANAFLRLAGGIYDQPENSFRTPAAATATEAGGPGTTSLRDSRNYYGNAQFNWQPSFWANRHNFVFGAEARQERSDNAEFGLSNWHVDESRLNQPFASFGQTFNGAVYGQDQIRLGENATIIAGLRYDYWRTYDGLSNGFTAASPLARYEGRTNHAITGKLAAAWQPINGFTVRGSVANAFRNPMVFELYCTFRLSSGTLFLANPELQSERLFSYEFGARQSIGQRTQLEATYYRNQISDLIYRKTDFDRDPTGLTRILVNVGEGRTNGIELSARQQFASWLQLRASYSYTDAVISRNPAVPATEGKRVPNIPAHMTFGSLLGFWKNVNGSLSARYVSGSFSTDVNSDTTKGVFGSYSPFFVMDASAAYGVRRGLEVFMSAENLLDRQYYLFYLNLGRTFKDVARAEVQPRRAAGRRLSIA